VVHLDIQYILYTLMVGGLPGLRLNMTGERGHRASSFVVLLVLAPYFPLASGQILQKYGCGRLPKQSGRKVKAAGKF
jgi:hypothetical protein